MDHKEKYEQALKTAKMYYEQNKDFGADFLPIIFPELRESEDERIREEIVDYFKKECECLLNDFRDKEDEKQLSFYKKALAWLEKQKEPENVSATTMAPSCWAEEPSLQKEQKPEERFEEARGKYQVEWSEEDEKMMNLTKTQLRILQSHLSHTHSESMSDMEYSSQLLQIEKCVSWLDIRLKSLRPSWKPREDEERLINTSISFLKDFADKGYENAVECIDWLKSKLNGNSCK